MIGEDYVEEEPQREEIQGRASISRGKEVEVEDKEPRSEDLTLDDEEFIDQDIIDSFYNVHAKILFLKEAMKRQMADRDKASEHYDTLKKDCDDLINTAKGLLAEILSDMMELDAHQIRKLIDKVNQLTQRVVVAKQKITEKDIQLATMNTTLQVANEQRSVVQLEFDIYLEDQAKMVIVGSSNEALRKENLELKRTLKMKQL